VSNIEFFLIGLIKHFVFFQNMKNNFKNKKFKTTIFYFSQFKHELYCKYFKRLLVFLAQCGYCVHKWETLGIVDEDVNSEMRTLLEY